MDFKKYTGYPENFNTNSKNQQFDFSNNSNNKINQNSNTLNFNYQNNSANYNYGSSAIDPNYGIKNYKSNNNLAQMQIMEKMYKKVEENTDAGKGARQVYDISSFAEAKVKKAYYTNQMDNFGNSYDYSCKNLSQALTNGGYEQGYKFSEIYNHDTNKEIQQFKNAISDNNFNFNRHINTDSIQLTNSFNDMLKTGRVEFTAVDKSSNERISSSYSIDSMKINTNTAGKTRLQDTATEREITGRKWIQSFADATHDRQMKLVKNNNLTNTFLQTDSDLRRFNIQKMSATQLQRELDLLKTNPARSVFNGFEKQLEATGKIELLQEVVSVKKGSELVARMSKANKNSKRVNKRQIMKFMNKASNGEDAIAGFQKIAVGKDLVKLAVKAPVSVNKAYHNLNRKSLQIKMNSNSNLSNRATKTYQRLYGETGKITRREARIQNVREKLDVKGKAKAKVKNKLSDSNKKKLFKKQQRHRMFAVKHPKMSKGLSKIRQVVKLVTNPIGAVKDAIINFIRNKIINVVISIFTTIFQLLITFLITIIGFLWSIIKIIIIPTIILVIVVVAVLMVFKPIGDIINTFKGSTHTSQESAKSGIYDALEGKYTDDEIDYIQSIIYSISEDDISYRLYPDSDDASDNLFGLGGLTQEENASFGEWIDKNGETIEPKDGESDKKGHANTKYIERIANLQTRYLIESGKIDEWLAARNETNDDDDEIEELGMNKKVEINLLFCYHLINIL